MPSTENLLALAERLRRLSRDLARRRQYQAAGDCRLASLHLQKYAALTIAEEAKREQDPKRRHQLEAEACQTWTSRHGG
jgi:hypothetical protein